MSDSQTEIALEAEAPKDSQWQPVFKVPAQVTTAERVAAWVSMAITRAIVLPVSDTDLFIARVPTVRFCAAVEDKESSALAMLEDNLTAYATKMINHDRPLPRFAVAVAVASEEIKGLVRLNRLKHLLKRRAAQTGVERQLLPSGAVDAFLCDLDALLTRHAFALDNPKD